MFVIFLAFGENAMSRTKLSGLGTRSDRLSLKPRNAPYWLVMEKGRALGYRKGANGGTWVARFHDPSAPRLFKPLGAADDVSDADGMMVLTCAQAQEKAREWFRTAYFQATGEAQRRVSRILPMAKSPMTQTSSSGPTVAFQRSAIPRFIASSDANGRRYSASAPAWPK